MNKDAFEYVLQLVQDTIPLSERIIKELHSLVLIDKPQDRGIYRSVPVRIMGATHELPRPYLVPGQNDQSEMVNLMARYLEEELGRHIRMIMPNLQNND